MQGEAGTPLTGDTTQDTSSTAPESTGGRGRPTRGRLFALLWLVAAVSVAADQLSKWWALDALADGQPRRVLGEALQLRLTANSGAAFSLGRGNTWVLTILAAVILVAVLVVSRRLGSRLWAVTLGLLLGGAVGNLVDRLVRPPSFGQGHVVDFIDYNGWFIGNVADIGIVAAAVLVVFLTVVGLGVDGTRDAEARRTGNEGGDDAA